MRVFMILPMIVFKTGFMMAIRPAARSLRLAGLCLLFLTSAVAAIQIMHVMVMVLMYLIQHYVEITDVQSCLFHPADLYISAFY